MRRSASSTRQKNKFLTHAETIKNVKTTEEKGFVENANNPDFANLDAEIDNS